MGFSAFLKTADQPTYYYLFTFTTEFFKMAT